MDNSQEYTNIAQRLEQLNQWQEEQKKLLFERQDNQRKVLGLEHKKMYEMLGIYHQNTDTLKEKVMIDYVSECESSSSVNIIEHTVEDEKENLLENEQIEGVIIKRPFLRRKQGLMNRFKVDPDNYRLDNLPPYKFQSKHPSIQFQNVRKRKVFMEKPRKVPPPDESKKKLSTPKKEEAVKPSPSIDMLEQKFQKSLIFSKTVCNSTPDMKSQSSIKDTPEVISWATILDPHNVKPIEKKAFHVPSLESQDQNDETSIFELLEQKAKDGSFNLNSSFIRKFLNKNTQSDEDDSLLVPYEQTLRPTPCEISQNDTLRNSESSEEETDSEREEPKSKHKHHVRFVETPSVNVTAQNVSQTIDSSDVSQAFEEFKKRIFENQSGIGSMDASQCDAFVEDILQKADLIKTRLGELELEIATFKQNNLELIKSKREHELEKAHFEQELKESRDKLNDERIQMEIYLHDERMKIEDERKEWEKKARLQKSAVTAKERREATKLREQVEALQNELKKKEEVHITSQSRLRSRIKNLEGNIRQLNTDMTELQKENKRLEAECLQMNRHHSDKMLREINRNIAKLAPKGPWVLSSKTSPPTAVASGPPPPAKQTTKQSPHRRTSMQKQKSNLKTNSKATARPITPTSSQEEDEKEESSDTSFGEHEFEKHKVVTFSKSPDREKSPDKDQENTLASTTSDNSFKREIVNTDGSKDIWYPNGNLKKISSDGMTIRMLYFNRDIKETNINEGTVKYYYAETNTWHTTYVDGLEILEFPNGQTEHRYKNGKVEVHFPNNSIKLTDPSDEHKQEEWRFADGSNLIQMKNGDKILLLSNGQKEIHTALSKRREYPDGTVKLVYPDGSQETRYSNGRIRLKDKDGKLIMDTQSGC